MAILKYKFLKGDEDRYRVVTSSLETISRDTGEETSKDSSIKMELLHKITDVLPDGTGNILVIIEKGPAGPDGKKQEYVMKMATNGKILEMSGVKMQNTASLPDNDVQQGSTWSAESALELPGVKNPVPYKNIYTLKSFEKVDNYDCAVITMKSDKLNVEIDVPDFPEVKVKQTIKSEGEIFFAYNEGKLVRSTTTTITCSNLPDGTMETEMMVKVELIQ